MGTRDPRIDEYIARMAPFAQTLLASLRAQVHAACPEVVETMKWSAPAFTVQGRTLCVMAGFKQHVAVNFHHGDKVVGDAKAGGMGQFGRIQGPDDLPDVHEFAECVRRAAQLAEAGVTAGRAPAPRADVSMPADLDAALAASPAARTHFDAFAPGQRREYIDWITGAKREDTRARRLAQAIEWIAEGKPHNWKYLPAYRAAPK